MPFIAVRFVLIWFCDKSFLFPIDLSDNLPYEKVGKNEPVCIADEVPFDIPESWEWVRLGGIFQHNTGKALNFSNRSGELLTYITTSNLYWNRFETDILRKMYFSESEIQRCTATKGDLLVCEGGDIGRAAIWSSDTDIRIQNHIHRLRPYSPICVKYYYYIFYLYKHIGLIGGKGIGIQGLSTNALHSLLFPLPPLPEQYRIVTKINEFEPLWDKYNQAEQYLNNLNTKFPDQLKKSILQEAVQGKLVPQNPTDEPASVLLERIRAEKEQLIKVGKIKRDKHESVIFRRDNSYYEISGKEEVCIDDEIPFEIPDSWVWVRLGTALNQASTGPFGSMVHKEDYVESGIPIVNPANIIHGNISSEKIKKVSNATANRLSSYKLKAFDIIIGRRGEMGRSAVVESHQEGWLCGTGCFFVTPSKLLLPQYLVFLLNSPFVKAALTENSVGTTMNNLNHNILQSLLIPVPPINEQKKIMTNYQKSTAILDG